MREKIESFFEFIGKILTFALKVGLVLLIGYVIFTGVRAAV